MAKDVVKYESKEEIGPAGLNYLEKVKAVKITSQAKYEDVVELTKQAKTFIAGVKAFFKPMKEKTHAAHKAVTEAESEALKHFQEAERLAKQRMSGWIQAENQKAEAKRRQQMQKAEEKGVEPPPPVQSRAKVEGISTQENYEVELTDHDAMLKAILAGKAPRNFISIDLGAIKRWANATKGNLEVPGVKVIRKDIVKVRR